MRDLIKDSLATLKKSNDYVCVTQDGEQITLKEATKKNIPVTILHPKQVVEEKLAEAGLPLTDTKFVNELTELINALNGGAVAGKSTSTGRKSFTKEERRQIVEGWPKAKEQGLNKTEYAKQVGVTYQSLINWLR